VWLGLHKRWELSSANFKRNASPPPPRSERKRVGKTGGEKATQATSYRDLNIGTREFAGKGDLFSV